MRKQVKETEKRHTNTDMKNRDEKKKMQADLILKNKRKTMAFDVKNMEGV